MQPPPPPHPTTPAAAPHSRLGRPVVCDRRHAEQVAESAQALQSAIRRNKEDKGPTGARAHPHAAAESRLFRNRESRRKAQRGAARIAEPAAGVLLRLIASLSRSGGAPERERPKAQRPCSDRAHCMRVNARADDAPLGARSTSACVCRREARPRPCRGRQSTDRRALPPALPRARGQSLPEADLSIRDRPGSRRPGSCSEIVCFPEARPGGAARPGAAKRIHGVGGRAGLRPSLTSGQNPAVKSSGQIQRSKEGLAPLSSGQNPAVKIQGRLAGASPPLAPLSPLSPARASRAARVLAQAGRGREGERECVCVCRRGARSSLRRPPTRAGAGPLPLSQDGARARTEQRSRSRGRDRQARSG